MFSICSESGRNKDEKNTREKLFSSLSNDILMANIGIGVDSLQCSTIYTVSGCEYKLKEIESDGGRGKNKEK